MGKMKISKKNKRRSGSGIPNWLLVTIVVVVVATVLLTCAATLVSSSGLVMRCSMAMKSDNYTVNGNMMTYYYVNTYNNFLNTYGDYATSFSIGAATSIADHHTIRFGGTEEKPNSYDAMFLGSFDGTWFDYFMAQTVDGVKSMLMYCEEAKANNIELTKEEKKEVKDSVDALIIQFRLQNGVVDYSDSTVLNAMYGKGVKKSDIRKAMEISALASKWQEHIYDKIESEATDEKITEVYEGDKKKYDLIDYYYYTFNLSYDDVAKEKLGSGYTTAQLTEKKAEVDEAYKAKMAEIKKNAEALASLTTLEDFKRFVYTYVANDAYQAAYDAQKLAEGVAPDEASLKIIKESLVAGAVKEALNNRDSAIDDAVKGEDGNYTLYGISVKSEFATAAMKIKNELLTKAKSVDKSSLMNRTQYDEQSAFSKWAFEGTHQPNETKGIEEGAKDTDFKQADKYMYNVYFLIKPEYKDEDKSRDVAYMMFQTQDAAKKAIEKLAALSTLDKAAFSKVATEASAAAESVYEDYIKGSMESSAFDEWLYSADTKIGSYTANPIAMSDGSFMVAYFAEEGEVCWKVTVKNDIMQASYNKYEDDMTVAHSSKIDGSTWTMNRIGK